MRQISTIVLLLAISLLIAPATRGEDEFKPPANGVITEMGTTEAFIASQNPLVRQFLQGDTEGPISVL